MKNKPGQITREEYGKRIKSGQQFRDAGLYEQQHVNDQAEFYIVDFGPLGKLLKRRVK